MASLNKVSIIGNLGADPESRQFSNGGSVTNISVATSEQWIDKNTGEKRESTEWHRIALFNRLGEIAVQYLRKGSKVYIEGSLHTRKWKDQNGQDRYTTEIKANSLKMLDSLGNTQQPVNQNQQATQQPNQGQQQPVNQGQAQPQQFNTQGYQNNQGQPDWSREPSHEDIPFS